MCSRVGDWFVYFFEENYPSSSVVSAVNPLVSIPQGLPLFQHMLDARLCFSCLYQIHERVMLQTEQPLVVDAPSGIHFASTEYSGQLLSNPKVVLGDEAAFQKIDELSLQGRHARLS